MNNKAIEKFAILVKDVKKSFKDKAVLKGVNLEIKKGEIFCLLGSNGAGKTTMIKILSTLLQMDDGVATVNGYDVKTQGNKVRRSITLTGQFTAIDDIMSGRENMEMIARLSHVENYKKEANQLLEKFNLLDVADKRVATYSGGMKRRLDIAMSLLGKPSVIFLDEPTTGLDPQSRIAMWEVVKSIRAQGITIFLTTQYIDEAEQLADRVAILHEGKIIVNDTVEKLKTFSAKEYISFTLMNKDDMEKMKELFKDCIKSIDDKNLEISVELKNGMEELSEMMNIMKKQRIICTTFTHKKASLEDVFLHFVDAKGEQYERKI